MALKTLKGVNMKKSKLTDAVLRFRRGREEENEVIENIAYRIYTSPILKKYLSAEQRNEFLSRFYTEIPLLISRFKFNGKSFEAYINFIIKKRIFTYLRKKVTEEEIQSIMEDANFIQNDSYTNPEEISTIPTEILLSRIRQLGCSSNKRILFLFLREYAVSDPKKLTVAARLTGFDEKWIQECGDRLRFMVYRRRKRISVLRKNRNRIFFLLFLTEKRLLSSVYPQDKAKLRNRISELKKTLSNLNKIIARSSPYPTHQEIAIATGNPKGSVDSGLYYIKQTFMLAAENKKLSA